METDDGITFVRTRLFRAVLTCTTCRIAVAVGPAAECEPMAAYELGRADGVTHGGVLHLGVCAGGNLDVTIEEVPNPPAASPARELRSI